MHQSLLKKGSIGINTYVDRDAINEHFERQAVGATDSLLGEMHNIPFHILVMKEPDYIMEQKECLY